MLSSFFVVNKIDVKVSSNSPHPSRFACHLPPRFALEEGLAGGGPSSVTLRVPPSPTLCFGGRPCRRRSWGLTLLCKEGLREVSFIQRDIEIPPAPLYERGLFLLPLYGGCLKTIKLPKYKLTVIGKKLEIARITQPPTPNPEPRCLSIQTASTKRGVYITPLL